MASFNHFSEKNADLNPFLQFDIWYKEHIKSGISVPDAVSLASADSEGQVSLRTVLLKEYDDNGFVFFTNYTSKKGIQLTTNPRVALLFYWPESARQVRIEGFVKKVSEEESESYFRSRPFESQISAWASDQSSKIPDRQYLEKQYDFFLKKFKDNPVEKPENWGGFRIVPEWFEFWQEGKFRLHDRITYTKRNDRWIIGRLAP
jgi:pyridoxamine 5'-phosphate oxidase